MTKPVSQPVIPAQPAKEYFTVPELALFKTYTRDTYGAAFGVDAAPFDPARLTKTWFDSTADITRPENISVYKVVGRNASGNWALRQLVMPASEAATVNLPGAIGYPAYVVSATSATRTGPGGLTPQPINADYLSSLADAQEMMKEVGGTSVAEEPPLGGGFGTNFPADETRRLWEVVVGGRNVNAGFLLKNRNAGGIGAPGHWDLSGETPVWMPDPPAPTGLDDARPSRELPVRDLLPNEVLQTTLMGVSVVRTDYQQESAKSLGQFTAEDRALLVAVYQAVVPDGE